MRKLKIGIVGAIVTAAVVMPLFFYTQSRAKLRAADAALQKQATGRARLEAEQSRLAGLSAGTSNQSDDRARLRGEVQRLRQETEALPGVQREQRRLQAAVHKPTVEPTPEQEQEVMARMSYGKMGVFACIRHAQASGGLFPSSFADVSGALPEQMKAQADPTGDGFEVVYKGTFKALTVLTNAAEVIVIRQRQPSRYGDRWAKVYVCADGHCEIRTQAEQDFSEWERQHMISLASNQ